MIKAIGKHVLISSLSKPMWGAYKFPKAVLILCGLVDIYINWKSRPIDIGGEYKQV